MTGCESSIDQARNYCRMAAWSKAFDAFAAADRVIDLGADDLERFSSAAYMMGRDDDYLQTLDRAHHAYLLVGEKRRSARCAFWIALRWFLKGKTAHATAWLARAQRLIEGDDRCAERGYLLLPVAERQLDAGDSEAAYAVAAEAVAIGERCAEPDLIACARHVQGRVLIHQGKSGPGLALLDETMLSVSAGELSPIMTGLLYCSVIDACQQVYAIDRAHEWTSALFDWCAQQPEMVAFNGTCLVHRAGILRLHGAWDEAIVEARRGCERCLRAANERAAGVACYETGEVLRLRGQFADAEQAYRDASRRGFDPQPGVALMRLAQGRADIAATALRRTERETRARAQRLALLPAYVDVMLAVDDLPAARAACVELAGIAGDLGVVAVAAMAADAYGAVQLAEGDAYAALQSSRDAWNAWQQMAAPYHAARARVAIGRACYVLGDFDGATLELDAARATFERLGAAPDREHVESIAQRAAKTHEHGLTQRELQVLRLIAAGKTNGGIASELSLSERTVDRHVSNIFGKLEVPSRAAATAYAFRHHLL